MLSLPLVSYSASQNYKSFMNSPVCSWLECEVGYSFALMKFTYISHGHDYTDTHVWVFLNQPLSVSGIILPQPTPCATSCSHCVIPIISA